MHIRIGPYLCELDSTNSFDPSRVFPHTTTTGGASSSGTPTLLTLPSAPLEVASHRVFLPKKKKKKKDAANANDDDDGKNQAKEEEEEEEVEDCLPVGLRSISSSVRCIKFVDAVVSSPPSSPPSPHNIAPPPMQLMVISNSAAPSVLQQPRVVRETLLNNMYHSSGEKVLNVALPFKSHEDPRSKIDPYHHRQQKALRGAGQAAALCGKAALQSFSVANLTATILLPPPPASSSARRDDQNDADTRNAHSSGEEEEEARVLAVVTRLWEPNLSRCKMHVETKALERRQVDDRVTVEDDALKNTHVQRRRQREETVTENPQQQLQNKSRSTIQYHWSRLSDDVTMDTAAALLVQPDSRRRGAGASSSSVNKKMNAGTSKSKTSKSGNAKDKDRRRQQSLETRKKHNPSASAGGLDADGEGGGRGEGVSGIRSAPTTNSRTSSVGRESWISENSFSDTSSASAATLLHGPLSSLNGRDRDWLMDMLS